MDKAKSPDYECKHCNYASNHLMDVIRHLSEHGVGACRIADHIRCNIPVRKVSVKPIRFFEEV